MKKIFPMFILLLSIAACDNNFEYPLSDTVSDFIKTEYKGAKLLDAEYSDGGLYEVEILHKSIVKEVYFNSEDEWVYTTWDVKPSSLPDAVKTYVNTNYPEYRIDDADFYESSSLSYYTLEVQKGESERTINLKADGTLVGITDLWPF